MRNKTDSLGDSGNITYKPIVFLINHTIINATTAELHYQNDHKCQVLYINFEACTTF